QTFTFYSRPTGKGYNGGIKNFHWKGGKIVRTDKKDNGSKPLIYTLFSLVHAQNISFENTVYDGIQNVSGHNYDIIGCKNVVIKNNKYYGYGFTKNVKPDIGNNSGQHPFYSEIIELDFPYKPGKVGDFSAFGLEVWNLFTAKQKSYSDDIPSRNISVLNNTIAPKKEKGKAISYSQNLIGSHVKRNNMKNSQKTGDILIKGNTIENPCPVRPLTFKQKGKKVTTSVEWNGIMHFTELDRCVIENNTIKINEKGIAKRTSLFSFGEYNSDASKIQGVIVKNNKISGAKGKYSQKILWGGSGKQVIELESKVTGWK
ncbi:MAG: hypothetical protein LBD38_05595, partial [Streptococcaceae bacterium]|nr:hypothetical protein [Streptococcaceae bacterium]